MPYLSAGNGAVDKFFLPSTATEWEEIETVDDKGKKKIERGKPTAGEYWVTMKRHAEYGDSLAAQAAVVRVEIKDGQPVPTDPDTAASVRTLVARLLVDWNLDDQNGKLPITPEIVDKLDPRDGDFLATEANKRVGGRPDEKQGPFGSISGLPSTATTSRTKKRLAS